jgi:hypothetical protein
MMVEEPCAERKLRTQLDSLNGEWLMLMRAGQFADAWEVSDRAQQLRAGVDCSEWPRHEQFIWRGAPLEDQRVLIRCYHGLGDTLQFARFTPEVRSMAREVVMWVQPALIPLLQDAGCADRLLPLHDGAPDVEYDVDIELAELMHALRVIQSGLAKNVHYLCIDGTSPRIASASSPADPLRVAGDTPLKVGLVWAAGEWNPQRSIPCERLARLGAIRGIEWHLLQRGPALSQWRNRFGLVPHIESMVDEARVMLAMDLIITVDTCSAHLAGSLGVPVWTLLPRDADWRWMCNRSETPWYPTMRLMRQSSPGAWAHVIGDVERELCLHAAGNTRC